jgi:hypothetical protein
LYDNGIFTSLDYPGSLSTKGIDLNNDTQVLLLVNLGSDSGYFLWDEGKFFPIQLSLPNALSYTIRGMNDNGQLVGSYAMEVGTDPILGLSDIEILWFHRDPGAAQSEALSNYSRPESSLQADHHGNQEQNVGGFPNQYFADAHCRLSITEPAALPPSFPALVPLICQTVLENPARHAPKQS